MRFTVNHLIARHRKEEIKGRNVCCFVVQCIGNARYLLFNSILYAERDVSAKQLIGKKDGLSLIIPVV